MAESHDPERRTFLGLLAAAAGAVAATVVAVPGVGYVLDPLLRPGKGKGQWRKVAKLDQLKETPTSVNVVGEIVDGWTKAPERKLGTVFLRVVDNEVKALSAECPHLGCSISYSDDEGRFVCPCHESFFSVDGSVETGPSPRAMDPLETKVEDGEVMVRFVRFRTQTSEREEIA